MRMELDFVSGSEMCEEEEWDDVDEVRRDRTMPQLRNDGRLVGLQYEK